MTCPLCKEKALFARPSQGSKTKPAIGKPPSCARFAASRLTPSDWKRFPERSGVRHAQRKSESGQLDEIEPDFCPNCGALVEVRVSRGSGITRYKRVCTGDPPCRL